ncbi:MAG: hypothetical protein IJ282_08065 [Lachnospiraceae bacterium]|nr:hypothetical protein [Lachnospiraceae bacterium]
MEYAILFVLVVVELVFLVWNIIVMDYHKREKSIVNISLLLLFIVLVVGGVIDWNVRCYPLAAVLLVQAVMAAVRIYICTITVGKMPKVPDFAAEPKQMVNLISKSIWSMVGKSILYAAAVAMLFEQVI